MVEGDQGPGDTEANNSVGLVLAHHGETERFLIKIYGTLQIGDLNADMVDVRAFETGPLWFGRGGRSAGGNQHRETPNQFSTGECAPLEARQKIGNDSFHA